MPINSLTKAKNLADKRVLVRVDFNVPIKGGKVVEDQRLLASIPTIEYLVKKKARVILVTHLGRPEGKVVSTLSVKPVAKRLEKLLGLSVALLNTKNFQLTLNEKEKIFLAIDALKPGAVVMLENIRFSPYEQKETEMLSRELATLADFFVLDGFAVAHRADASVAGVAKYLPSFVGLLLEKEISGLVRVLEKVKKPFVAVIGGAKMETKIPVIKNLLPKVDALLVGGGIVNTYLKAAGYDVGASLVDKAYMKEALSYAKNRKVVLPLDLIVGSKDGKKYRCVNIEKDPHKICKKTEAIFDVGPATIRFFAAHIKHANTLLWNGAMGYFEQKPYSMGTLAVARLVAARSKGKAFGVIGGGETVESMKMAGMSEFVDLISTGGGAMLEYISGKKLPGIEALYGKRK